MSSAITHLPESKSRITARVTPSVQSLLEEAAACLGIPLNSFVVSAAVEKAGAVLETERVIRLSREDAELFARTLDNPSGPNESLLKAAQTYRGAVGE
jgi:uncharacterized protein (DUF1778 family)